MRSLIGRTRNYWALGGAKTSAIPAPINPRPTNVIKFLSVATFVTLALTILNKLRRTRPIPYMDRNVQTTPFSPRIELWLGNLFAKAAIVFNRDSIVSTNDEITHQVQKIGENICAANSLDKHRFFLLYPNSPVIDVPIGNNVFIPAELLVKCSNQSDAAMVIGRELAHLLAGHKLQNYLHSSYPKIIQSYRKADPLSEEFEADKLGLHLMARACYDPNYSSIVKVISKSTKEGEHRWELLKTEYEESSLGSLLSCLHCDKQHQPGYNFFGRLEWGQHDFAPITDEQIRAAFEQAM